MKCTQNRTIVTELDGVEIIMLTIIVIVLTGKGNGFILYQ